MFVKDQSSMSSHTSQQGSKNQHLQLLGSFDMPSLISFLPFFSFKRYGKQPQARVPDPVSHFVNFPPIDRSCEGHSSRKAMLVGRNVSSSAILQAASFCCLQSSKTLLKLDVMGLLLISRLPEVGWIQLPERWTSRQLHSSMLGGLWFCLNMQTRVPSPLESCYIVGRRIRCKYRNFPLA